MWQEWTYRFYLLLGNSTYHPLNKSLSSTYFAFGNGGSDNFWILDTRATYHLTNDGTNMGNPTHFVGNDGLLIGNGASLPISYSSSSYLNA